MCVFRSIKINLIELDYLKYDNDNFSFILFFYTKDIGAGVRAKNFMPFGCSSRSCAGAEFTKVLMATFLHVLVTNYR